MEQKPTHQICVLSDTHGHWDEEIENEIKQADEVWHAGDIGPGVLSKLQQHAKKLWVVKGNIDAPGVAPYDVFFESCGLRVMIVHDAGLPDKYNQATQSELNKARPNILVCGHNHILQIARDSRGVLFLNPGAAGIAGQHRKRTLLRLPILNGQITKAEVVTLADRGREAVRNSDFMSVLQFAALHKKTISAQDAIRIGKLATAACEEQGMAVEKIPDPRYGAVNAYPEVVLKKIVEDLG